MLRSLFRNWRIGLLAASLCLSSHVVLTAADPAAEVPLSEALTLWRQGDLPAAHDQLSKIIENGSSDPRLHYYRGVISEQQGADGTADFKAAAALEVASGSSRLVNFALEKIQGPVRAEIEAIRARARAVTKPDPTAVHNSILYRDARISMKTGDLETALQKLDQAVADGARDPRVHYMRGVILATNGDVETARLAFQEGLEAEVTAQDARNVNEALQGVQGDIRRLIEEQLVIERGDEKITRQSNQRMLRQQEDSQVEKLMAADDADRAALLAQSAESQRAKELAAAQQILAEEKLKAETEALLNKSLDAPPASVATEPATPKTTAPVSNPFGGQPKTPAITPQAEAETPASPVPAAPVNPFLSGNSATTSASSGPVDCSWLAPNTELVSYFRPADFTNSRFMAPLMELPPVQAAMAQMVAQSGFAIGDIESITFGIGDVMAAAMGIAANVSASGGPPDPNQIAQQFLNSNSAVSVLRLKKDVDFTAFAATVSAEEATHGDKTYYLMASPDPSAPKTAAYPIDARTILMTPSEAALKAAIGRGPGSASNPQFDFLSRDSQMALAFSNPALAPMSGAIPQPPADAPPFVQTLADALRGRIAAVAIVLNASADLRIDVQLKLTEPSAGNEAVQALQSGIQMLNQIYPSAKANIPPDLQPVTDSAVSSLAANFSDPVVTATITIPGSVVSILQNSPQMFGPLQFGPPGAGPVPGDPSFGFGTPTPGEEPAAGPPPGFEPPATTPPAAPRP